MIGGEVLLLSLTGEQVLLLLAQYLAAGNAAVWLVRAMAWG